jgi:hypothetical protein
MIVDTRFNISLSVKWDKDYTDELQIFLSEYLVFSEELLDDLKNKGKINNISHAYYLNSIKTGATDLINILTSYVSGNRTLIHEQFYKLMAFYKPFLNQNFQINTIPKNFVFYRVRSDKGIIADKLTNPDYTLFHIPFNKRFLVNNLRYNPHGIPCLYCANNLRTAWIESKEPAIDASLSSDKFLNTAIFLNEREINCLDFSLQKFDKLYDDIFTKPGIASVQLFLQYSAIYPLIAALHTDVDYKPFSYISFSIEYLAPTLLMDWLIKNSSSYFKGREISSIKYSSVEDTTDDSYNFAFPSSFDKSEIYCKNLTSLFLKKFKYFYSDDIVNLMGITVADKTEIMKIQDYMLKNI